MIRPDNTPKTTPRQMTLAHALMPAYLENEGAMKMLGYAVMVLAGSGLVAISAQISVPLYPVPVTAQTLVVLMIGMAFGPRLGAATLMAYLVEGAIGIPVFANGGAGLATLAGPTGGYLVGFLFAATLTGWLAENGMGRGMISTAIAMIAGMAVIYLCGVSWLSGFVGFGVAVTKGLLPFLYGDALKIVVAVVAMPLAWSGVRALGRDPAR